MRSAALQRQKRSPVRMVLLTGLGILGIGFVTVVSLRALGLVELSFWHKKTAAPPPPVPVGVPVPLSAHPIPAYTRLTREDFVNPKTGELEYQYFPENTVKKFGFITDLSQIIGRGRVLSHDKAPGYAFTEKDFFPEHTRAGVVAGIPPEKRSFLVQAEKIHGLHNLKIGDRFDLVATVPLDPEKTLPKNLLGNSPNLLALEQAYTAAPPKRASSRVLVQDGLIILPVAVREVPLSTPSTNNPNERIKTRPVQEATLAVDPSEVLPLTEALTSHAELMVVARSGRPEDRGTRLTPATASSVPAFRATEIIIGSKRHVVTFPTQGGGPVVLGTEPSDTPDSKGAPPAAPK